MIFGRIIFFEASPIFLGRPVVNNNLYFIIDLQFEGLTENVIIVTRFARYPYHILS